MKISAIEVRRMRDLRETDSRACRLSWGEAETKRDAEDALCHHASVGLWGKARYQLYKNPKYNTSHRGGEMR